jgi:hypothetical protein
MFNTGISLSSSYLKENCHSISSTRNQPTFNYVITKFNLAIIDISVLKSMDLRVRNLVYYVKGRRKAGDFQKNRMLWKIFGPQTEEVREKLEKND